MPGRGGAATALALAGVFAVGCAVRASQDYTAGASASSQPASAPTATIQGAGNVAAQATVDAAVDAAVTGIQYVSGVGIGTTVILLLTVWLSHRREMARLASSRGAGAKS